MRLSLNIEEPEEVLTIKRNPLEGLQSILDDISKKSTGKTCPNIISSKSGAFGSIDIKGNKVRKVLSLINKKDYKTLSQGYDRLGKKSQMYFLVNRLNNYCKDIKDFSKIALKMFPNNFVKIYNCKLCGTSDNPLYTKVYVEMGLGKGKTLKEAFKTLKAAEVKDIIAQIYYITLALNMKRIYHNDVKGANIIIAKATKAITYDALASPDQKIVMKIKKGQYYPIIIDYDLSSKKHPETPDTVGYISPGTPDFSFFSNSLEKLSPTCAKLLEQAPDFYSPSEIKKGCVEIVKFLKMNKNISTKCIKLSKMNLKYKSPTKQKKQLKNKI